MRVLTITNKRRRLTRGSHEGLAATTLMKCQAKSQSLIGGFQDMPLCRIHASGPSGLGSQVVPLGSRSDSAWKAGYFLSSMGYSGVISVDHVFVVPLDLGCLKTCLKSQAAQHNGPLYPNVAHNSLNIGHNHKPAGFGDSDSLLRTEPSRPGLWEAAVCLPAPCVPSEGCNKPTQMASTLYAKIQHISPSHLADLASEPSSPKWPPYRAVTPTQDKVC